MVRKIPVGDKFALIDDEDYESVSQYTWYPSGDYAITSVYNSNGVRTTVTMHRLVFQVPGMIDHENQDGLDNRRSNLRCATNSQNQGNRFKPSGVYSSIYKGVTWDKRCNRWLSQIKIYNRSKHLGRFNDEAEAACAYDRAAIQHFGEFAYTNFPREDYDS